LRRVLLSSLQGGSITAVRIEGVLHEFSTLPGVIEDVTEIILNLKQVRLKLHGDGPKKGIVEMKAKGEVRAKDIQVDTDVEVLNKSVEELERSVRSSNCLRAAEIKSIGDLVRKSEAEMLKFRNFGRKSLKEIQDILGEMGLHFGMDITRFTQPRNPVGMEV